jgi:hypothetical protein
VDRVAVVRVAAVGRRRTDGNGSGSAAGGGGTTSQVDVAVAAADAAAAASIGAALSDSATVNAQLLRAGLPAATSISAGVRAETVVQVETKTSPVGPIIAASVAAAVVAVLAGVCVWRATRDTASEEEKRLRGAAASLRKRLRIGREDGHLVSGEAAPWGRGRGEVVHLQQGHMDAAARLSLYQDFDANQVCARARHFRFDES